MKKRLLIIFLVLISNLYASDFDLYIDFGHFWAGTTIVNDKKADFSGGIEVIDIKIIDRESGFGISAFPVSIGFRMQSKDEVDHFFNFVNASIYYDVFHFNRMVEFGPYVAAYTVSIPQFFDYKVEGGLRFLLYPGTPNPGELFRTDIIALKVGGRLQNNKPYCFIEVGVNLFYFLFDYFSD